MEGILPRLVILRIQMDVLERGRKADSNSMIPPRRMGTVPSLYQAEKSSLKRRNASKRHRYHEMADDRILALVEVDSLWAEAWVMYRVGHQDE